MNEYTATNRVVVHRLARGIGFTGEGSTTPSRFGIDQTKVDALREFFRAERDEELGRTRFPEYPGYVVYRWSENFINVACEGDGTCHEHRREDIDLYRDNNFVSVTERIAREWFAAHPEPKPAWHDAKPGEVWALTVDGSESAFYPSKSLDRAFTPVAPDTGRTAVGMESFEITAGHRIFPEVSS